MLSLLLLFLLRPLLFLHLFLLVLLGLLLLFLLFLLLTWLLLPLLRALFLLPRLLRRMCRLLLLLRVRWLLLLLWMCRLLLLGRMLLVLLLLVLRVRGRDCASQRQKGGRGQCCGYQLHDSLLWARLAACAWERGYEFRRDSRHNSVLLGPKTNYYPQLTHPSIRSRPVVDTGNCISRCSLHWTPVSASGRQSKVFTRVPGNGRARLLSWIEFLHPRSYYSVSP